ncbi:MAG: hypothetical protein CMO55_15135 [Verrucomicrobiales bacterium]|nr:hypothetical protein [Verrucomicrobiales bacterium]
MNLLSSQGLPLFLYAAIWISILSEAYVLIRKANSEGSENSPPPTVVFILVGSLLLSVGIFVVGPFATHFFRFSSIYFAILLLLTVSFQALTLYRGTKRKALRAAVVLVSLGALLQFFHFTHDRIICIFETRKGTASFDLVDVNGIAIQELSFKKGPFEISKVAEDLFDSLSEKVENDETTEADRISAVAGLDSALERLMGTEAFRNESDDGKIAAIFLLAQKFVSERNVSREHWRQMVSLSQAFAKFSTDKRSTELRENSASGWSKSKYGSDYENLYLLWKSFPATKSNIAALNRIAGVRGSSIVRTQPFYVEPAGITGGWRIRPRFD